MLHRKKGMQRTGLDGGIWLAQGIPKKIKNN